MVRWSSTLSPAPSKTSIANVGMSQHNLRPNIRSTLCLSQCSLICMSLQLTHKQHYASNAWTFIATSPPHQPRPSHTSSTPTHNGSFKKPKRTMRHIQCRRGYFAYVDPALTKTTYFDGAQIGGCFQPKSHSSFWAKLTVSGWKTTMWCPQDS